MRNENSLYTAFLFITHTSCLTDTFHILDLKSRFNVLKFIFTHPLLLFNGGGCLTRANVCRRRIDLVILLTCVKNHVTQGENPVGTDEAHSSNEEEHQYIEGEIPQRQN